MRKYKEPMPGHKLPVPPSLKEGITPGSSLPIPPGVGKVDRRANKYKKNYNRNQ